MTKLDARAWQLEADRRAIHITLNSLTEPTIVKASRAPMASCYVCFSRKRRVFREKPTHGAAEEAELPRQPSSASPRQPSSALVGKYDLSASLGWLFIHRS